MYLQNPLIHKDRRRANAASAWVRSFRCDQLAPLVVCRGPIRKEAMDVFEEMGIRHYGILLSEKDSIVYTHALAPELRQLTDPRRVHRVPDYSGANKEERVQRMNQIITIARDNDYNAIFAGYGFMAEDEEFVHTIEAAGLTFIGPCSGTVRGAGRKDEAKRTALAAGVSVTPGVDNVTTLTLLADHPDREALLALARTHELELAEDAWQSADLESLAVAVLEASYARNMDLISIEQIAETVSDQAGKIWQEFPKSRIRLKAIGGGGGKGQRILNAPAEGSGPLEERILEARKPIIAAAREVLSEVKATGVGDNKNMLLELNIEYTRHQEIQLIGNGDWCLALGARDCSLQMHEQKLLEVSNTSETLSALIADCDNAENRRALEEDLGILLRMEEESARFGQAVGLDSVSTFECIVDRSRHFFMEMNTRIQVEHRVTELCYSLRFTNPEDPEDSFEVDALVEAMVLLAAHKRRLPKPERVPRTAAALEARLNATNAALAPHAGGVIHFWSDPLADEIRDDQGICLKNPDTGLFMKYRLAGAYDSNIALLVTPGKSREDAYRQLAEVLRRTKLNGRDLATNLEFHYGLVSWFLYRNTQAKATTSFVLPYLTMVGQLKDASDCLDLGWAYKELLRRCKQTLAAQAADPLVSAGVESALARKQTLILRPLVALLARPHVLSGWLSRHRKDFEMVEGQFRWLANPWLVLSDTYRFLNMDLRDGALPAEMIWTHDDELLNLGLRFYAQLAELVGEKPYAELVALLDSGKKPESITADLWHQVREAHLGFSCGMEMFGLLGIIAEETRFFELKVLPDLTIEIPHHLTNPELQERMRRVLVPPPVSGADEIVAASGGMYYAREAPGMAAFVEVGDHFEKGQPLYIIEVMKMFNKVCAPFSGTVDRILLDTDGLIVAKGQTLFKVTPDERIVPSDPKELVARQRKNTERLLARLLA